MTILKILAALLALLVLLGFIGGLVVAWIPLRALRWLVRIPRTWVDPDEYTRVLIHLALARRSRIEKEAALRSAWNEHVRPDLARREILLRKFRDTDPDVLVTPEPSTTWPA